MSRSFRGRPDPNEEPLDEPESEQAPRNDNSRAYSQQARGSSASFRGASSQPQPPAKKGIKFTSSLDKYGDDEHLAIDPMQVDIGKRLVAGLIDVFAGYLLGMFFNCLPLINLYVHDQFIMVSFLVVRDALFNGRGVGKNLMGLQVVDIKTGQAPSFLQSIKRNIVVFGPYMLLYAANVVLKIVPNDAISSMVTNVVTGIGTVYTLAVIPYEAYRVYSRVDGRRWGDAFAGTAIIPADMDFSNPLSK